MSARIRVGLAQITGEPFAVEENRALSLRAAAEAADRGAALVVLPELIVHGYVADRERLLPVGEPLGGPTVQAWSALARERGFHIAGGFCELDGGRLYNSAVVVGPSGLVLHYRKVHLFGPEKEVFAPGDLGFPVADLPFGRVGVCVCYDLRFVEVVRILALRGVELVCVPTAWLPGYDVERWDAAGMCPQGRGAVLQANLDQVFIACASQAGRRGELEFLGASILADPYGKCLIGPLSPTESAVAVAEVDLAAAAAAQERGPLISPRADRRTDVYAIRYEDELL